MSDCLSFGFKYDSKGQKHDNSSIWSLFKNLKGSSALSCWMTADAVPGPLLLQAQLFMSIQLVAGPWKNDKTVVSTDAQVAFILSTFSFSSLSTVKTRQTIVHHIKIHSVQVHKTYMEIYNFKEHQNIIRRTCGKKIKYIHETLYKLYPITLFHRPRVLNNDGLGLKAAAKHSRKIDTCGVSCMKGKLNVPEQSTKTSQY